jgi:hypothetical protein
MIIGESSIEIPRCNVVAWSAMVPKTCEKWVKG